MKARELYALCAARGVNITAAAQGESVSAPPSDTRSYERCGLRITKLRDPADKADWVNGEAPRSRVYGRGTRSMRRPEWTMAELGQAAGRWKDQAPVPTLLFQAACYAFAGNDMDYWVLVDALLAHALRYRRTNGWPFQVTGEDGKKRWWLDQMCCMVLDEDRAPHAFAAVRPTQQHPSLHAMVLGVTEDLWARALRERYELLQLVWWSWLDEAVRTIAPRLREDDAE